MCVMLLMSVIISFPCLTPVMESNVDKITAANIHWEVMKSSVSGLVGEAVTAPTNMDCDVHANRAAVELSLAE